MYTSALAHDSGILSSTRWALRHNGGPWWRSALPPAHSMARAKCSS
ncbi:MAG: hypothetical protein WBF75_03745 [Pseudonocardiaceae bacterium]